ncbi:MAG TPA: citrate synthase [Acidimicrobiales bacterium]|nr:citrate synthase [Acidimicrobiales bacterium]
MSVKVRTVADVMSTPVVTAAPSETVAEAATRMSERRVGSVVVVDGLRPIGILTERDLIKFAAAGADPVGTKVSEWMTEAPDCVDPDLEVAEAWSSLGEHGYRHMPVTRDGELVGLVSMRDLIRIAQIRPVEGAFTDVPRGLKGVIVTETEVGDVRGLEGFYHYRQYSAIDLCEQRPIEDVWRLLFDGALPETLAERESFIDEVRPLRDIPADVGRVLPEIATAGEHFTPLDALRTSVSLVAAAEGFRPCLDVDRSELRANAMRISALVPTLITALYRLHNGLEPIHPHPELPYAANYLYMLTGDEPSPEHASAVEHYMTSTIDHGFNASTFTARVVASTGADLGAAVVAGIGALSGPLHGGAPSRALDTLDAIGHPDNAAAWIRNAVERGERIMGFGHAVYKTEDPRSNMLRGVAQKIGPDSGLVQFATRVEKTVVDTLAELKPGRELYANVEFYAGVVMELAGLPRDMFTPTFASSRVIGWCTNILEQASDNRIIRPSARYVGPPPPEAVPAIA